MFEDYKYEFSFYEWLDYFSNKSNHWVLKYWRNNRETFFDRFTIIGDQRLFIIADKYKDCVYEFKKPDNDLVIQLNLNI